MRPIIKLALAFLVLGLLFFMYLVTQAMNSIDATANHHHDSAMASMIETACLSYLTEYNRLPPSYDNQKLTAALLGDNSRHIAFISLSKDQLDSDNEMVDRWGTPLRINFQGATGVQVISAGPDRLFNTADDIVVNSPDIQDQASH